MQFLQYLKNPHIFTKQKKVSIKEIIKIYVLMYLIIIIPVTIKFLLIKNDVVPNDEIIEFLSKYSNTNIFFLMVILAPIFEETIFRLNLIPSNKNLIIGIIAVIFYISLSYFIAQKHQIHSKIVFILIFAIHILIGRLKQFKKDIDPSKQFKVLFYFSAIAFGFVHIFNIHELNTTVLLLFPIITFPQIMMGFIFGYVRMKYGFIYSIAVHAFNNLIPFVLLVIFK